MSNNDTKQHCHRINELMSGYIDNELSQQESQYVSVHIENCKDCKASFEEFIQLKQAVKEVTMPEMESDKIDAILNEPVTKWTQIIAFSILIISVTICVVLGALVFLFESNASLGEKLIVSLIWGSIIGLILSVARQQWVARKTDKYKGVKL